MNPLPSIEVLSFLDWMDGKGYFPDVREATIEEFILKPENNDQLRIAVEVYLSEQKQYDISSRGDFEFRLDKLLAILKTEVMQSADRARYFKIDSEIMFQDIENAIYHIKNDYGMRDEISSRRVMDAGSMIDAMRVFLNYMAPRKNNYVSNALSGRRGTSTNAVREFKSYLARNNIINVKLSAIPDSVINKYINNFEMDYFQRNNSVSAWEAHDIAEIVKRVLLQSGSDPYFLSLTDRYQSRAAEFKCVFLSDTGADFYELVEKNWQTLHEYSANHLDIFYQPEELKPFRGYNTADCLKIRSRVERFPCIYIWKTVLDEGLSIPVDGLDAENLLEIVKVIVDEITAKKSLQEIVECTKECADMLRQQLNQDQEIEKHVINNLLHACLQLQNNPILFTHANENMKNTQIRDLMGNLFENPLDIGGKRHQIRIVDQSLQGFSAKGKALGELDLQVKVGSMPFSIIEGIIIKANETGKQGRHWNRSNLYEHIKRFGNYDQNGLERNILLVYLVTDCFDGFYQSMLACIPDQPKTAIRGSNIYALVDIPIKHDYAAMRLAEGKYLYNGRERKLYIHKPLGFRY